MGRYRLSENADPTYAALTSDLPAKLEANARRVPELKAFECPVRIIFKDRERGFHNLFAS